MQDSKFSGLIWNMLSSKDYPALAFFPEIVNRVSHADEKTIHLLHLLLFSNNSEDTTARRNILRFCGFEYHRIFNLESRRIFLDTLSPKFIENICHALHINITDKSKAELIDMILSICKGSFNDVVDNCEDWHGLEKTELADENIVESIDVFEDVSLFQIEDNSHRDARKIIIQELQKYPPRFKHEFDSLWKNFSSMSKICERAHDIFAKVRAEYVGLIKEVKKYPLSLFHEYDEWKPVTNDLLTIAAYIHFLENRTLITQPEALKFFGFESDSPITIRGNDMVVCWLKLFEQLADLSESAMLNADYYLPYKIFKIMLRFKKTFQRILPSRGSIDDRRMRNFKSSMSRVLTVLYNAKMRKNITYPRPPVM